MKRIALVFSSVLLASCLDPAASDVTGYSSHVLGHSAHVASLEDDDATRMKLDMNDGIDGELVALHTGFADGIAVTYWDFGTSPASIEPLYRFRRRVKGGADETIGHPDLIDSVPGDMSYSPLRAIYLVYVTSAYDGERITSLRALDDAVELGLVEEPEPTGKFGNCPVMLSSTRVEAGEGVPARKPDTVYYREHRTTHLCLESLLDADVGLFPIPERGPVPAPSAYALQRKNDPVALDEAVFKSDLDGDGDQLDSNVVFSVSPGAPSYSSIWSQVSVIVPASYAWGDSRAQGDLFEKQLWGLQAIDGAVLSSAKTDVIWNRPIRGIVP
jgi:hypothetical protein